MTLISRVKLADKAWIPCNNPLDYKPSRSMTELLGQAVGGLVILSQKWRRGRERLYNLLTLLVL